MSRNPIRRQLPNATSEERARISTEDFNIAIGEYQLFEDKLEQKFAGRLSEVKNEMEERKTPPYEGTFFLGVTFMQPIVWQKWAEKLDGEARRILTQYNESE
jgi:hypothetical protein